MTVAFLDRLPECEKNRDTVVHTTIQSIDSIMSDLTGLGHSSRRLNHLEGPVTSAAKLAVALAKQPVSYAFSSRQGDVLFDPDTMEDALQTTQGRSLTGRRIRGVVFPALLKSSTQIGEKELCIRKAEVIL